MKNAGVAACFAAFWLFVAPVSSFAMTAEASALFDRLGVKLSDADLYRVREFYNFWHGKGETIWPGVNVSSFPIQFVFPEKSDLLIGHSNPPKECQAAGFRMPVLEKDFCWMQDKTFMYGAMSGRVNKVPTLSVNTMDVYDYYATGIIRKSNPKADKYSKPYLLFLGELAHETFHAFQSSESEYLPAAAREHKPLRLTKIDYPYQDEENCLLLGLEGRILAALLDESSPESASGLWRDFSAVRTKRHGRLPADIVMIERLMELKEGTAQYVGWSVQYGKNDSVRPLAETLLDSRFSGYSSTDTLKDIMRQSLLRLGEPSMSRWMLYVYYTGAAMSFSLDKAVPDWKNQAFRRLDGLTGGLDTVLFETVPQIKDAEDKLKSVYARYGADAMRKDISAALARDLEANSRKLEGFGASGGKHYRLIFDKARPEDVVVMGPVLLTEYREKRVFEAGASKLMWIDDNWDSISEVTFSKALPLLINRKTGEADIVVPDKDFSEPKITAGKSEKSPDGETYSGGVEFSNGIWEWKGEWLEVGRDKGITTLRFHAAPQK